MHVSIRPVKPEDAAGVIDHMVEVAGEPDICLPFTTQEALVPVELRRQIIQDYLEHDNFYVVGEANGKIVAETKGWTDYKFSMVSHIGVLGMSISKEYRNQGLGTRMMEMMIEWARRRNLVRLELEVFSDNAPAIHLYEKFGFELEGRKRKYVCKSGVYIDHLVMGLLL